MHTHTVQPHIGIITDCFYEMGQIKALDMKNGTDACHNQDKLH